MPTEINGYSPSEETALSSLVINEVDSNETFEKMKEKGILQDNQLYLVTDEQEGGTYYTAGEVDALLVNKAPAGYGLGTTAKKVTDWNNANVGEWCTADPGAANSPDESHGWFGVTYASWTTDVFIQDAFALVNVDRYYHRRRMYYPVDGAGTPWEWVDPPFDDINTVYRTTERHLGNPVYKKMDSNGIIWWSTDQTNWKVEAERTGAYSKTETNTLLQNNDPRNWGLDLSKSLTDANDGTRNGFYAMTVGAANVPFDYGVLLVHNLGNPNFVHQELTEYFVGIKACRGGTWDESTSAVKWEPWEYVNPPMALGVEYRTTERYLGKPVYAKVVSIDGLPNNGIKTFAWSDSYINTPFFVTGYAMRSNGGSYMSLPTDVYHSLSGSPMSGRISISAIEKQIAIKTDFDATSFDTVTVYVKYTKTTD